MATILKKHVLKEEKEWNGNSVVVDVLQYIAIEIGKKMRENNEWDLF